MRRTGFDTEHSDYRESVRRFISEEIAPHNQRWERAQIVDRELFTRAAEKGLLAMQVPERYGASASRTSASTRSWARRSASRGMRARASG
jgi:alkylation response protein AidB-like acyl-CoA dehydrogenase